MRAEALMGTIVTIRIAGDGSDEADAALERAFGWFREIEARCTRFDEASELRLLMAKPGVPAPVSTILFEAVRFALMVAEESGGAFDPSGGGYREIVVDEAKRTVMLRRPLALDLGAVAKGLAVDTAARELASFRDFVIDAGGDLYLGGKNADGEAWSVGIRHPRKDGGLIDTLRVSDMAVCTSGDYERPEHIRDPRTGAPAAGVASATVIAPGAMLADALATAAFVLGPVDGIELLERVGVGGLIITPQLERFETKRLRN